MVSTNLVCFILWACYFFFKKKKELSSAYRIQSKHVLTPILFAIIGSIIVNPWNTEELANGIYEAVTMPDDVRKANHQKLFRYVTKYTAAYWGLSFVNELRRVSEELGHREKIPELSVEKAITQAKQSTKKRVI